MSKKGPLLVVGIVLLPFTSFAAAEAPCDLVQFAAPGDHRKPRQVPAWFSKAADVPRCVPGSTHCTSCVLPTPRGLGEYLGEFP